MVLQDMETRKVMEAYFKNSKVPILDKESNSSKKTYRTWDYPPVRYFY